MSKSKFILIGICLVLVILGLSFPFSTERAVNRQPIIASENPDKPANDFKIGNKAKTGSKLEVNPGQISKSRESDVFNPELMFMPDYMSRVQKHLRIKLYHQSPASDTVECAQILNILNDYQLGVEAVCDAYSLTWQYHYETKSKIKGIPDGEFKDMIIAQTHGRSVQRFLSTYKLEDPRIIDELLKVTPKVFFGNVITDVNIGPGERLLVK
jgi:hypothetical protein